MANILIIDDDAMVSELLAIYISRSGHKSYSASSYEEAEAIFSNGGIDAVFCDYKLPECSGLQMYSMFKDLRAKEDLRFALITGAVMGQEEKKFIDTEGINYIVKPFSEQDIKKLLSDFSL
ncbi:MAG: response regulator [Nitrospirae bacterium]|nr:response regulator [Nitrospirota bacterium]